MSIVVLDGIPFEPDQDILAEKLHIQRQENQKHEGK